MEKPQGLYYHINREIGKNEEFELALNFLLFGTYLFLSYPIIKLRNKILA